MWAPHVVSVNMRMTSHDVDNVNMTFERPYHHGNLRAALIEAGMSALEQHDASELSLRAIARDVGVSANAAYRHFADKQALLSALAAEGFRRFAANQQAAHAQASQQGSSASGSMAAGQAYIAFAQTHPALFRLMFGHLFSVHKDPELMAAAWASFQFLLSSSAQDMHVDAADERAMIMAITRWSLVHGLSHLLLDGQLAMFGDQSGELVRRVLQAVGSITLPSDQPGQASPSTKSPKRAVRR